MNINNFNLDPLNYTIVYCSSSDPNFPIENINKKSRYSDFIDLPKIPNGIEDNKNIENTEKYKNIYFNPGWSSLRFCSYPQIIIIQLSSLSDIKQINIELNHERVPQKIDVFVYCPSTLKEVIMNFNNILNARFNYIGSVIPVNHNYDKRELKKLIFHNEGNYNQITIKNCLYIKFVIHINYQHKNNKFNQVGIVNIDIFGNHNNKILPVLPLNKVEQFKNDEILPRLKGLYTDNDYDEYIKEKIEKAKMEYYTNETLLKNEEKRNKIYQDITLLRELGQKVLGLNKEKEKFEYFGNDNKLMQINMKLKEIKDYIETTYPYYGKENIKYVNENLEEELKINIVEDKLNESKNDISNTNINNISDNNYLGEQENIYMEDNNNINDINLNRNILEKNKVNEVSERSKEILRRHQEKQRMIRENLEIAEQNRKNEFK